MRYDKKYLCLNQIMSFVYKGFVEKLVLLSKLSQELVTIVVVTNKNKQITSVTILEIFMMTRILLLVLSLLIAKCSTSIRIHELSLLSSKVLFKCIQLIFFYVVEIPSYIFATSFQILVLPCDNTLITYFTEMFLFFVIIASNFSASFAHSVR